MRLRLPWPGSLQGQVLLALAAALLLAQVISGVLLYRVQAARREEGLVHSVAMRLFSVGHHPADTPPFAPTLPGALPIGHGTTAPGARPPFDAGPRKIDVVADFAPIA